jgi:PIN domain nuclease of toxin-antitoxin system
MKIKSIVAVLDASAIFAIIKGEPINFVPEEILEHCVATTYNIAEVANKMVLKKQVNHQEIWILLESMISHPYNIDMQLSELATGFSEIIDASFGVSLGDKYCLALGKLLNKPIYTADRAWKQFEALLDVEIVLIR